MVRLSDSPDDSLPTAAKESAESEGRNTIICNGFQSITCVAK
jgi:hypothetical protein